MVVVVVGVVVIKLLHGLAIPGEEKKKKRREISLKLRFLGAPHELAAEDSAVEGRLSWV